MSWERQECFVLICDSCGVAWENGDYIPHYDQIPVAGEAFHGDGAWADRRDLGKHWCYACIQRRNAAIVGWEAVAEDDDGDVE